MKLYQNQPAGTVDRARSLRRGAPAPERRLLRALRTSFPHLKWRHQAPIGPFYADMLCFSEKLVIEVDGDTHTAADDARRDAFLAREGFRTLRFTNAEVTENRDGVLALISLSLREREGAAQPRKGEGDPETRKGATA
ncbi:DUF559 domain-containing protein [uncultured Sphingomonas sp.]|uniref:endonuclease domain-containing protein n=1 Tax=uncultured Sphingomonas sp. TaxID=158754 RepID=UPI00258F4229|nr:DUF559 domain-containing protein [uncultured Sphingomonas sp.]